MSQAAAPRDAMPRSDVSFTAPCRTGGPRRTARRRSWIAGIAFALALAAGGAAAHGATQPDTSPWLSVGPPGGGFSGLFATPASPATVYLAVQNGAVWRSRDGGHTWTFAGSTLQPALQGFPFPPPLVVDPGGGDTVYANDVFGFYKSVDGGATWAHLHTAAEVLAVAPSAPQTVYLYDVNATAGLSRSDDGGQTWHLTGTFPVGFFFAAAVAVDPSTPATVYVQGSACAFIKSVDSGATWIDSFSPSPAGTDRPLGVFIDPANASTLYLALARSAAEGGAGAGLYRSDDAGATWVAAAAGLPADLPLSGIVVAPSRAVYAAVVDASAGATRIFASSGGGAAFQQVSAPAGTLSLAADFQTPDHLLLLGSAGVQWSDDGGRTWSSPDRQPSGAGVSQVAAGPGGAATVYALGTNLPTNPPTFLQKSDDGGGSWTFLTSAPLLGAPFLVLDAQPGILYAISHGPAANVWDVSFDDATTWSPLGQPSGVMRAAGGLDLAADPIHPGKLVELSRDQFSGGPDQFTCALGNVKLSHSNTRGRGWRLLGLDPGLSGAPFGLTRLDPSNPRLAYAIFNGSLFRSDAASLGLKALPLAAPVRDLAVDSQSPATLYAASGRPRPMWKSLDHGATWAPASIGLPRGAGLLNLVIDPTNHRTLYLATSQGVFFSDDQAASWQPLGTGLPAYTLTWVAASTGLPRTVWVGTAGGGVFALTRP